MHQNIFLKSEHIYLRPLEISDINGNYPSWLNNPDVCKYNNHHRYPYTTNQAKNYIESLELDKSKIVLAIIDIKSDLHIGNISLQNISYIDSSAELAIIIGQTSTHGKGIGFSSSFLMLNHGFNQLNLNRIYCGTTSLNIGMKKIALKLGMQEEGIRREASFKNGEYLNIHEYGILKREFIEKWGKTNHPIL